MFGLRRELRCEAGFTVAELVVAVAILFVGITALFALQAASTTLSIKSKQRALAVDAANSYIEDVRAMPYGDVGTAGGNPTGALTSREFDRNGLTVTVDPTVTWVDDPKINPVPSNGGRDYKKVTLAVSITGPGVKPYNYSVATYVRRLRTDASEQQQQPEPTIEFVDPPAQGTPVSGSVTLTVRASHTSGVITVVRIWAGSRQVHQWTVNSSSFGPESITWNTAAIDADTAERIFKDGSIEVRAEAVDTLNGMDVARIGLVIDNDAPDVAPRSFAAQTQFVSNPPLSTSHPVSLSWIAGEDGGVPARTRLVAYRQGATDTQLDPSDWGTVLFDDGVPTPAGVSAVQYSFQPTTWFSRYYFTIQAVGPAWPVPDSPRGYWATPQTPYPYDNVLMDPDVPDDEVLARATTTRPYAEGTIDVSGANEVHNLRVSAPTFACSVAPRYTWQQSEAGGAWESVPGATDLTTNTFVRTGANKNRVYSYRCKITYTPAGYGAVSQTAYSQMCGQTSKLQLNLLAIQNWSQWW